MGARSRRRRRVAGPFDGLVLLALLVGCLAAVLGTLFLMSWGGAAPGGDDGAATFGRSVVASGVDGVAGTWFDGAFIAAAIAVPIVALPSCCAGPRARWVGLALGAVIGGCAIAIGVGVGASGRPEELAVGTGIAVVGILMLGEGVLLAIRRAPAACWLAFAFAAIVVAVHLVATAQLVALAAGALAPAVVLLCVPLVLVAVGVAARARRAPAVER